MHIFYVELLKFGSPHINFRAACFPVFYINFHHSFTNEKVFVPLLHISFADLGCLSSFSPFLVHFLGFY